MWREHLFDEYTERKVVSFKTDVNELESKHQTVLRKHEDKIKHIIS